MPPTRRLVLWPGAKVGLHSLPANVIIAFCRRRERAVVYGGPILNDKTDAMQQFKNTMAARRGTDTPPAISHSYEVTHLRWQ